MKEEALAVNPEEGCELTSEQMLTVRSIVLKRCGVAAYRKLRKNEVEVKEETFCNEEVKKLFQHYSESNKF